MFSQACVKNSVHRRGVVSGRDPPSPGKRSPWADTPPDGYCSGRYTSYWNAFLLPECLPFLEHVHTILDLDFELVEGVLLRFALRIVDLSWTLQRMYIDEILYLSVHVVRMAHTKKTKTACTHDYQHLFNLRLFLWTFRANNFIYIIGLTRNSVLTFVSLEVPIMNNFGRYPIFLIFMALIAVITRIIVAQSWISINYNSKPQK